MEKKRGLGRNLHALLGSKDLLAEPSLIVKHASHERLCYLSVDKLQAGQYQPRRDFIPERLQELADSIAVQGVLQPLVVRQLPQGDMYEIVAGERRWRAAKMAGLDKVPVVIRELSEQAALAIAIIENLQRENLNPMEQAIALQRLQTEFSLTQAQVAEAVGKSRSAVTNILRLMNLEPSVRIFLEHGDLEMGHAKALLGLTGAAQVAAAEAIVASEMTVRQAEDYVQTVLHSLDNPVDNPGDKPTKSVKNVGDAPGEQRLDEHPSFLALRQRLQAKCRIKSMSNGCGRLVIPYQDEQDLLRILSLL